MKIINVTITNEFKKLRVVHQKRNDDNNSKDKIFTEEPIDRARSNMFERFIFSY